MAGPVLGFQDVVYRRAIAELGSHGVGSRKRSRNASHIPAWGDMQWNTGLDQFRDGKRDLEDARGMAGWNCDGPRTLLTCLDAVAMSTVEIANVSTTTGRHATFTEERLTWIPRKRHSSRWPIEPKAVQFEVPATVEQEDVTRRIDDKELGRRSTRRLSRRLSLFPVESSPRKMLAISLSPVKISASALSPIKRMSLLSSSPTKVAESPHQSFSLQATPNRILLESPKAGLPAESPSRSTPLPSIQITPSVDCPAAPIAYPLVFDQPASETLAEPEYEIQRRRSLHLARRSERRSSGVSRLINFESAGAPPSRRHSLDPTPAVLSDAKQRRKTLNVLSSTMEDMQHTSLSSQDNEELTGTETPRSGSTDSYAVVKVDAGITLDIFGPSQELKPAVSQAPELSLSGVNAVTPKQLRASKIDALFTSSPIENTEGPSATPSVAKDIFALKMDISEPIPSPDQTFSPAKHNEFSLDVCAMDEEPASDPVVDEESPVQEIEPMQEEYAFEDHDPEGLSTIYEESFVTEAENSDAAVLNSASASHSEKIMNMHHDGDVEPHINADHGERIGSSSPPSGESAQLDNAPQDMQFGDSVGGSALFSPTPAILQNHVTSLDALAESDSPTHLSTAQSSHFTQLVNMDRNGSASPPQESVGTPEMDLCPAAVIERQVDPTIAASPLDVTEAQEDLERTPQKKADFTSQAISMTPETPSQPALRDDDICPSSSPKSESSGFTPINTRQVSPPGVQEIHVEEHDSESESDDPEADAGDEVMMSVEDETGAIDDDFTLSVVASNLENDTLQLQSLHDDSETEMLRKFVTRVAADRDAKAAAAAAAKPVRAKRRSGSMGSATSTGSPIARSDTPQKRTPLGERSTNSPSPQKKRKLAAVSEFAIGKDDSPDVSEDSTDLPRLKRRRKRGDPVLEATDNNTPSPNLDSMSSESGPRRSTRSRSGRVALKPAAPSANSVALSLIPVRLPGMDDAMMEAHLAMAKSRKDEKDVAAVTRVNTRKNKGSSLPPKLVLAQQSSDPIWRLNELRTVFDAKQKRAMESKDEAPADGRKSRKAKGVRWAEELVRYQSAEAPSAFKALASSLLADIMGEDADDVDELAPAPKIGKAGSKKAQKVDKADKTGKVDKVAKNEITVAEEPMLVEKPVTTSTTPAATPVKNTLARRTRSSRLQAPTPLQKIVEKTDPNPAPTKAPAKPVCTPTLSKAAVTAAGVTPAASTTAKTGMATRRSKIAKLGMGVNGTPAPKRRGRPALA